MKLETLAVSKQHVTRLSSIELSEELTTELHIHIMTTKRKVQNMKHSVFHWKNNLKIGSYRKRKIKN